MSHSPLWRLYEILTIFAGQGHALLFKPKTSVGNAQMCAVCETVMAYVTTLLKQNNTEVQLEHVLQKVCNFLPKNLQQEVRSHKFFMFFFRAYIVTPPL